MAHGTMHIGFSSAERIKSTNISRDEFLKVADRFHKGEDLVLLSPNLCVNPSQVTYLEFQEN